MPVDGRESCAQLESSQPPLRSRSLRQHCWTDFLNILRGVRQLALRIGHGEEIAVGIVAKRGDAVDGVGYLGDTIQRIRRTERLLPEGIR